MFEYKLQEEIKEIEEQNSYNKFMFKKNIKRHGMQSDLIYFKEATKTGIKFRSDLRLAKLTKKQQKMEKYKRSRKRYKAIQDMLGNWKKFSTRKRILKMKMAMQLKFKRKILPKAVL